jgi:L-threonylcarbamoyladenylate synthase
MLAGSLQIPGGFFKIDRVHDMKTRIVKISPDFTAIEKIQEIVEILRRDGVIVYPTETYYGLGTNGFSADAIKKVYLLKKRAPLKPVSVVVADFAMLKKVISGDPLWLRENILEFQLGPLTIIFKASSAIPDELLGENGTIGVRLTEHPFVNTLVRMAGFPITATSANISGETPVSDPVKAMELFEGAVDLIVDGGKTKGLLPSTVVDFSGERPRLIREGAVPISRLKKYWPSLSEEPL